MIWASVSARSQAARRICWAEVTAPPANRTMSQSESATIAAVRAVDPSTGTPPGVHSVVSAAGSTAPMTWYPSQLSRSRTRATSSTWAADPATTTRCTR